MTRSGTTRFFFFQAEDGIRYYKVTGVQTCALPIWLNMSGDTARYAYAWALANIEYIVQADGMGDVERILDRIGAGMATETALRDVLHSGYDDLMQSAAEYQIGRGSCRERVEISVGAVSLK